MSKMIKCKTCGSDIASNAKTCPSCGAKNKKPFYTKVWFWVLAIIIFGAIGGGTSSDKSDNQSTSNTIQSDTNNKTIQEVTEVKESVEIKETPEVKKEPDVPKEYTNALKKAQVYSDTMYMSKKGIYKQLTSEYGDGFTAEAAQYAIDNVDADYNYNAYMKALNYQDMMSMSQNNIYDQLISEYGEEFTEEEATYAVNKLNE